MRVVLAPDCWTGTGSADVIAARLAVGWRRVAPDDDLVLRPMSDGGPGFVAALAGSLSGARMVADGVLVEGDTAYVESSVMCSPEAVARDGLDVLTGTTHVVGLAIRAASREEGMQRVVVGLGGSGTNDGGAGVWAALGAEPEAVLRGGGAALRGLRRLTAPSSLGVELVAATDVDNPLLGLHGASAVFGPQKGADRAAVMLLDAALEDWADEVERVTSRGGLRNEAGAGAAGGLGFGLLALGAERVSGVQMVIDAIELPSSLDAADLVVTGEGSFDATSLLGKVVSGVTRCAQDAGVPVVVASGQASVGAREAAAHGIDEIWAVTDLLGSADAAMSSGLDGPERLGAELARSWSRAR